MVEGRPGDTCPDNVYYQNNSLRFLDFEFTDEHLPKLTEASIKLLAHLRKIWPETQFLNFFPVFK